METALLQDATGLTAAGFGVPEAAVPGLAMTGLAVPGLAVVELIYAAGGVVPALCSLLSEPRRPGMDVVLTIWKMPTHEQLPVALRGECILQVSLMFERIGDSAILDDFVRSTKPVSYQLFAAERRPVPARGGSRSIHFVPTLPPTAVPALISGIRANPMLFSLEIALTAGDMQIVTQWAGDATDPMSPILAAII